jgi:hypothetical protein
MTHSKTRSCGGSEAGSAASLQRTSPGVETRIQRAFCRRALRPDCESVAPCAHTDVQGRAALGFAGVGPRSAPRWSRPSPPRVLHEGTLPRHGHREKQRVEARVVEPSADGASGREHQTLLVRGDSGELVPNGAVSLLPMPPCRRTRWRATSLRRESTRQSERHSIRHLGCRRCWRARSVSTWYCFAALCSTRLRPRTTFRRCRYSECWSSRRCWWSCRCGRWTRPYPKCHICR